MEGVESSRRAEDVRARAEPPEVVAGHGGGGGEGGGGEHLGGRGEEVKQKEEVVAGRGGGEGGGGPGYAEGRNRVEIEDTTCVSVVLFHPSLSGLL